MSLFPIFLKLQGRRCLIVGAGTVASEKIPGLLDAGADLTVIAPRVQPQVEQLAVEGRLKLYRREFNLDDLHDVFLVVTATDSAKVNRAVYLAAQERGLLCNSVDDPPNCDFYFASVVKRGDLQIAISTAGESPAIAQRLRKEIDAQLPADAADWVAQVGRLRREVLTTHPAGEERKALLHTLAQRSVCESEHCPSRQLAFQSAGTVIGAKQ